MHGKIVLFIVATAVGQAVCTTRSHDGVDAKRVGEQFVRSAMSVSSRLNQIVGLIPVNSGRAHQTYELAKSFVFKGLNDMETGVGKLGAITRKKLVPATRRKFDELENDIIEHTAEVKRLFEQSANKIVKLTNDKYNDDLKKVSDNIVKSSKAYEEFVNKALDKTQKP